MLVAVGGDDDDGGGRIAVCMSMAMAKKSVGQQYDLLQSYSNRCSRAVRLAAACVVIFFHHPYL